MTSILLLLLALLSTSTAKFHCPKDTPCQCASSPLLPGGYQIYCHAERSIQAGFDITLLPAKFVHVECKNSPNWTDFPPDSRLDFGNVERLKLSGCELPSARINRLLGVSWAKSLTVEKLKSHATKQHLEAFPGLKILDFSDNRLGNIDVDFLHGSRNLTKLNLRATGIRIPPGFFAKSRSLTHLDLSRVVLSDLEPGAFEGLASLRALNLSGNSLEFLQPRLLRGLSSLRFLDVSRSRLYALSSELFRDTANLTRVNLSANQLINVPPNLFSHGLGRLKYVQLERNQWNVSELPSRLFADLPSLAVVSLEAVGLRRLPEDLFWGSIKVVEVNLNGNELEALPVGLLRDARELRKITAASNKLAALPEEMFANANKLMKLDLARNRIATLNRSFSDGLQALLEMNFEDNELAFVHADAFASLRQLKVAKFARNRLSFPSDSPRKTSPFYLCSRLEELDLAYNEIGEMFADWLGSLGSLEKLNLSYNNLSYLETKDLQFASKRLSVDLSYNRIKLVNVSSLSHLRDSSRDLAIDLNGNPIDCHCEVYPLQRYAANPGAFEPLRLRMDEVSCSSPPSLRGARLRQLGDARLECSAANGRSTSCASAGACDCRISPANRSLSVDCAARNLTEAPIWIGSWDELRVSVDLSGNALTRVPIMRSHGYDRVQSLSLAENRIARLDENLLSPALRSLHLERNNLTSIDALLMRRLTESVTELWLRGNPWLCDDTTLEFRRFVQEHRFAAIADYREVLCDDASEPLWRKPLNLADMPELLARGVGAFVVSVVFFCLFFVLLVKILVGFLHHAAASTEFREHDHALVSYCDDERDFVRYELAAKLEAGPRPYLLYVRERERSRSVADVVDKTSRAIVVLSRDFFDQPERRAEYEAARDRGCRVIFVVRVEVEDQVSVRTLRAMTPADRWIRWDDEKFWEKLFRAMATRR